MQGVHLTLIIVLSFYQYSWGPNILLFQYWELSSNTVGNFRLRRKIYFF